MSIPTGTFVLLTYGEYDDYAVLGLYTTLVDLDISALRTDYLTTYPDQAKPSFFNQGEFVRWMVEVKRLVCKVPMVEWHLGDYANANDHWQIGG